MFKIVHKSRNFTDDEIIDIVRDDLFNSISSLLQYSIIGEKNNIVPIEEVEKLIDLAYKDNWIALDLSNFGLSELPASICKLRSLKVLDLGNTPEYEKYNTFTTFPDNFSDLENLIYLGLYELLLNKLPKNIERLQKLRYLNLNSCKLEVFPKEILSLRKLESLCLGISSPDFTLHSGISKLINLKELYMPEASIRT